MMNSINSAEYVELKRSIYREYSLSYDEDRQLFVPPEALLQRIRWALEPVEPGHNFLDLGFGSGELLLEAHRQTGGLASWRDWICPRRCCPWLGSGRVTWHL